MSKSQEDQSQKCNSCGIRIAGTNAASFACPQCGQRIHRCATCRKQSNLYQCPDCGFTGP
jgi:predicted RNA-binding Zn-ribbon protein involved in translation (DUF1610 family)